MDKIRVIKRDGSVHIAPAINENNIRRIEKGNIKKIEPFNPKPKTNATTSTSKKGAGASAEIPKKVLNRDEMEYQARLLKIVNYHRMSDDTLRKKIQSLS